MKKTKKCPVCGGEADGYKYESDEEQVEFGFPSEYEMCACCMSPLVAERSDPRGGTLFRQLLLPLA